MSDMDRMIDNPMYSGMSLRELLETSDLFDMPWQKDLKGDKGRPRPRLAIYQPGFI